MERMWRDENHEVWQAVVGRTTRALSMPFILRAGDVTLLHDGRHARRAGEARMGERLTLARTPTRPKRSRNGRAGASAIRIFPDRFRRVDVPGEETSSKPMGQQAVNEYQLRKPKGILEAMPY